jgi:hypothetical protein
MLFASANFDFVISFKPSNAENPFDYSTHSKHENTSTGSRKQNLWFNGRKSRTFGSMVKKAEPLDNTRDGFMSYRETHLRKLLLASFALSCRYTQKYNKMGFGCPLVKRTR